MSQTNEGQNLSRLLESVSENTDFSNMNYETMIKLLDETIKVQTLVRSNIEKNLELRDTKTLSGENGKTETTVDKIITEKDNTKNQTQPGTSNTTVTSNPQKQVYTNENQENETTSRITDKNRRLPKVIATDIHPPGAPNLLISGQMVRNMIQEELLKLNKPNENAQAKETGNQNVTKQINDAIRVEFVEKSNNTKRSYKLSPQLKFEHFYELYTSELRTCELLYVIDEKEAPPKGINEETRKKHVHKVRDILINRIDNTYLAKVFHYKDPKQMLRSLKDFKLSESSCTTVSIRRKLYSMQYNKGTETAIQFWDRFDETVRAYDNIEGVQPLSDDEKRDAFFGAIAGALPAVQELDFLTQKQTGHKLSYESLKAYILQKEATNTQLKEGKSTGTAFLTSGFTHNKWKNDRCFACGDFGHLKSHCNKRSMKKCYECNKFGNHVAKDCWQRNQNTTNRGRGGKRTERNNRNDNYLRANNKQSFKPRGQGNGNNEGHKKNVQSRSGFRKRSENSKYNWDEKKHQKQGSTLNDPKANMATLGEGGKENEGKSRVCLSSSNDDRLYSKRSYENECERTFVSFIADTGATEHLAQSKEILDNFNDVGIKIIKCANKDEKANLITEGQGNLHIYTNTKEKRTYKLDNVIASKSLSDNLLSLRRFAEDGWKIHLDNKQINIHDPNTDEVLISGAYESPYWIIELQIDKRQFKGNLTRNPKTLHTTHLATNIDKETVESPEKYIETLNDTQLNELKEKLIEKEDEIETNNKVEAENNVQTKKENNETTVKETENPIEKPNEEKRIKEAVISTFDSTILDRKITNVHDLPSVDLLECDSPFTNSYNNFIKSNKAMLWHVRIGHVSLNYLKKLQQIWKDNKELQSVKFDDSILNCEVCALSKIQRLPFRNERSRATKPLQIIHSDLMGKISPATHSFGYQYIAIFVDDYSRLAMGYPMKSKDNTGHCFEQFIMSARNLLGSNEKICYLRSDRGTEFTGGYMDEVLTREGIEQQLTCPDTPQHNGTSERFNQTIQKKIRALLLDSKLPTNMWDLALGAAIYAYNRTPNKSIDYNMPLKKFAPDYTIDLNQLKRFGCLAYWRITRKPDTKFSARAIRGVLVGYSPTGYQFLNPETGKFYESRDVKFNEKLVYGDKFRKEKIQPWFQQFETSNTSDLINFGKNKQNDNGEESKTEGEESKTEGKESKTEGEKKRGRGRPKKRPLDQREEEYKITKVKQRNPPGNPYNTRSRKIRDTSFANLTRTTMNNESIEFSDMQHEISSTEDNNRDEILHAFFAKINNDPTNFKEAMTGKDSENWRIAVEEELNSMKKNEVWELVDRPKGDCTNKRPNIVDSKWIFKIKTDKDGGKKFKARLVIRGFKDINTYELKETYAPVSRLVLVRIVLAIINHYDLEVCQLDVKTAFLNGTIDEEIYMEIPEGVDKSEELRKTKVCKIKRALYGLRISPKRWNEKFSKIAHSLGLVNDNHDPCLFTWHDGNRLAILILYVDDMLIASNDREKLLNIKTKLKEVFEISDMGEPQDFLGMKIRRDRRTKSMTITQTDYIEKILENFGFSNIHPKYTPMVTRQVSNRNRKDREEESEDDSIQHHETTVDAPYREAVGSLLYLAGATRPDIAYAVNILSRHQTNPTENEWDMVKRVFAYLKDTMTIGLNYIGRRNDLVAYSDASFADSKGSISTCGYVVKLFGDTIAWKTQKQRYVALSTCQAEYVAMSYACQETISISKSLDRILNDNFLPATLRCDNKAANICAKTSGGNKLRHMTEIKEDYVKECEKENRVNIIWVSTKEQLADIMTKPLSYEIHVVMRDKILNHDCTRKPHLR